MSSSLKKLDGLQIPIVRDNCTHVYYMYQMKIDCKKLGVSHFQFLKALEAEGLEGLSINYANIHLYQSFRRKLHMGIKVFLGNQNLVTIKFHMKKGFAL